jgi:DNA-directed RNA polymerase subunit RPC12/RpoP
MDIHFDCSHCGQALEVDDAGAGITIDCPQCGKPVYIPTETKQSPLAAPRVPKAPVIRERITPRVPRVPSSYADRVKELTQEAEDKRKLAEYVIEPGVEQWRALNLAAQILKVLAVLSITAWLLYPFFVWWETKSTVSEMSQTMGLPGVQLPSFSALLSRKELLEIFGGCLVMGLLSFGGLWVTSEIILLLVRLEQNSTRVVSLLRDRRQ